MHETNCTNSPATAEKAVVVVSLQPGPAVCASTEDEKAKFTTRLISKDPISAFDEPAKSAN
ncbi:MAG: hypothetical protein COA96_13905 [SAR86 cluster bacterium]|uniref:Uncharacterized protein n=1 Tax=SAR86 cluster bacterium TaxID=2030880 RepID=A0A2A5ATQ8_9GAMM|nr:MAG: hypothetical protein COA96_13905 [SAR86 cluster bacterium]